MEVALQRNDGYSGERFGRHNINTVDGGTHLSGFARAYPYHQRLRPAGRAVQGRGESPATTCARADGRGQCQVPQPQFEGQTKGRLNSDIAGHDAVRQHNWVSSSRKCSVAAKLSARRLRRGPGNGHWARDLTQRRSARFPRPARQTAIARRKIEAVQYSWQGRARRYGKQGREALSGDSS
jgi:DNA gyrase subunit B